MLTLRKGKKDDGSGRLKKEVHHGSVEAKHQIIIARHLNARAEEMDEVEQDLPALQYLVKTDGIVEIKKIL